MKRISPLSQGDTAYLDFEGRSVAARDGEPLACALLVDGVRALSRSVKYHRPRGPFCFAAACSNCLMRVDGVPNQYACQVPVRSGMRVERQNAFPSADFDVFKAADWVFPKGFNHHEFLAGVPIASTVMAKVARRLAGLGQLPDAPAEAPEAPEVQRVPVAVVGAGAAGLAAARVLQREGTEHLLLDRRPVPGGSRPWGLGAQWLAPTAASARFGATAVGLYEDGEGHFLGVVQEHPGRLLKVYAQRFLFATGGHPRLLPFEDNDLPGIYAGRALAQLVKLYRVRPGARAALLGTGAELASTADLLSEAGVEVALRLELGQGPAKVVRAHGLGDVSGLTVVDASGTERRVDCDVVGVCLPPAPAFELARHAGAEVAFDASLGAISACADAAGRTARPEVFVAGEVCGVASVDEAAKAGARAAEALAAEVRHG